MATVEARARSERQQVAQLLAWARHELGLTEAELAKAASASTRSVSRWVRANNRPSARHRVFLEQLGVLRHALQTAFRSDLDAMHAWLHEPLPAFGGRSPMARIVAGRIEDVVTALANLHEGVFV